MDIKVFLIINIIFISSSKANELSLRGYGDDMLQNLKPNATFTFDNANMIATANDGSGVTVKGTKVKDDIYDWQLKVNDQIVATLKDQKNITGTNNWNITFESGVEKWRLLNFHTCEPDQFPCSNGDCVSMDERCNLVPMCDDLSDEDDCSIFTVKDGYNKNIPNVKSKNETINVKIRVNIIDVYVNSLKSNSFTTIFDLETTWNDPGLMFMNLQDQDFNNLILPEDQEQLWTPNITFEEIKDRSQENVAINGKLLKIKKKSEALEDDPKVLVRNRLYKGEENELTLSSMCSVSFYCRFQTHQYPFEDMKCQMNMTIGGMKADLTNIDNDSKLTANVTYFGEYEIIEAFTKEISSDNGKNILTINFSFKPAFKYPLLNWYLPLFVLILVSQLTAFLDLERFYDTALAVNATIFVAVSSFFTSITTTLAPSGSEKMTNFEFWLTITFIYPFLMILFQVISKISTVFEISINKTTDMI